MDHENRKQESGRAGVTLLIALLACVLIAGTMCFQLIRIRLTLNDGNPEALFGLLESDSKGVADIVGEQFSWLNGVAARMATQPDEEAMRALLPEAMRERDALLRLCLLGADGTGVSEEGGEITGIAAGDVLRNALYSPWRQAMEYFAPDSEPTVQTAVAFSDDGGGERVLLAIQPAVCFTAPETEWRDLLIVTQRGDVVATSGTRVLPKTGNLLDTVTAPDIQGTSPNAMYMAFLDLRRGISWHLLESGWVCLLYAPIEGTDWMSVLAFPGNMIYMGGEPLKKLPALIMKASGACAGLCALLLCAVFVQRAFKRKRTHGQPSKPEHVGKGSVDVPPKAVRAKPPSGKKKKKSAPADKRSSRSISHD
ncbi:MAG: hypothetical protein FWG37_00295 [Clostridia bacterium]|nr:hypothetical protein [Clostridia bacterium]